MGSTTTTSSTPYWNMNLPDSEQTDTCPPFLQNLNAKDISILSTSDAEYKILSWPEVQAIIAANRLDAFQRVPSALRKYFAYNAYLKKTHGSVMEFVLKERLGWTEPITPKGKPFEREDDVKVLWNDWPYGIDGRIVHLVVWTKFDLEDDPKTDDLTVKARAEIENYVAKVFGDVVGKENVIWFKNWRSLKSVHAVEHFHVMLFDPDPEFVKRVTNGDVPLSQKV